MKSRLLLPFLLKFLCLGLALFPQNSVADGVELHAHLFMKEAMSWMFKGDFNGPLQAKSWEDGLFQANPEALEKSGLSIVVATLYANPLFSLSMRDAVRRQVALAQRFVRDYPSWVLAKSPDEARAALSSGKRVIILALEGASGILETEEDIREFVDQDGIRIVTLLHLTDDDFGGVAFLDGFRAFATPIALLTNLISPMRDSQGNRVNTRGLSERGAQIATALIRHKVWIDLTHGSDASQKDLVALLEKEKQPLLYTHTALRQYHHAERGITNSQLQRVSRSGGFIGLMPSEDMIGKTVTPSECKGSVHALSVQFREVGRIVGMDSVTLGSDFNGGINHLKPSCGTGTSLDQEGFWNIGQTQELWKALDRLGTFPQSHGTNPTTKFLDTWARLWSY